MSAHIDPPRRPEPSAELVRSRRERLVEFQLMGGLAGRRAIRRRLAAVKAAKGRVIRDLTMEELDLVLAPIACRRTRVRLEGIPWDGSHGIAATDRPRNGFHDRSTVPTEEPR